MNQRTKDLLINTPMIKVSKKVISFNDNKSNSSTNLQISNISSVSVRPYPETTIPRSIWVLLVIGCMLLFIYISSDEYERDDLLLFLFLGLMFVGISIAVIYYIVSGNENLGKFMKISMNGGDSYFFTADTLFLEKMVSVISFCIDNPDKNKGDTIISVTNSRILNSPMVNSNGDVSINQ